MLIDLEALHDLKQMVLNDTGKTLTDKEATEMGLNLIEAVKLVYGIESPLDVKFFTNDIPASAVI